VNIKKNSQENPEKQSIKISLNNMSNNLNGNISRSTSDSFDQFSRGFFYGDGLFESIRVFDGIVPFIHLHWERLEKGMRLLGFNIPSDWSGDFFRNEILKITSGNARVKISVWRSPGGLYHPTDQTPNFLITANPLDSNCFKWLDDGLNIGQCTSVKLPIDTLSGLKVLGGTRYVMAAIEAHAKGFDDVMLSNTDGHVCETSSNNIFWIKKGVLYVPLPKDGHVLGIFQNHFTAILQAEGIEMVAKSTTFAALQEADEVFLTNAIHGIQWVRLLEGTVLKCEKTIMFFNLTVSHLNRILLQKTDV
jgi:branched-chain amino acid aminotransferase